MELEKQPVEKGEMQVERQGMGERARKREKKKEEGKNLEENAKENKRERGSLLNWAEDEPVGGAS